MHRSLAPILTLLLATLPAWSQPTTPEAFAKTIDLGPLAEFFDLVEGNYATDGAGALVTLKLRVKKEVDTTDLRTRAGFFDKNKLLLQAVPVRFKANLLMKPGESVQAIFLYEGVFLPTQGPPWQAIAVRPHRKPI